MDILRDTIPGLPTAYDEALDDKTKILSRIVKLDREVVKLFKGLPYRENGDLEQDAARITRNGGVTQVYARTIEQMKRKTGLFAELEKTQILNSLLWELSEGERFQGVKVGWDYAVPEGAGAQYVPERRQINLLDDVPSEGTTLLSFAQTGNFPNPTLKLLHEFTHTKQIAPGTRMKDSSYHKHIELHEAQAAKSGESPIGAYSNTYIAEYIRESGLYGEESDRLAYALEVIDQMTTLNYKVSEITNLVRRPDKWDPEKKCYTRIQVEIDKDMKAAGFSRGDLKRLVEAHNLERQITYLKAMHIAQSEIKSAAVKFAA